MGRHLTVCAKGSVLGVEGLAWVGGFVLSFPFFPTAELWYSCQIELPVTNGFSSCLCSSVTEGKCKAGMPL